MNRQELEAYKHTIEACINLLWRAPMPSKVVQVHVRRLEKVKEMMDDVYWGNVPMGFVNDELLGEMMREAQRSEGQRRPACP